MKIDTADAVRIRGCAELNELYARTPKDARDYWLWTEVFVALHGGDVCSCEEADRGDG